MFYVHFQNDGELIIHSVPCHTLQSNLFRNLFSVLFTDYIVLFTADSANYMHLALQYSLNKRIVPGRKLTPISKGITLHVCMSFNNAANAFPFMGNTIDNDDLESCFLTLPNGF